MANEEVVGHAAAAERLGLAVGTWRKYVSDEYAPAPHRRENRQGHSVPIWYAYILDAWQANRPGVPGRPRKTHA